MDDKPPPRKQLRLILKGREKMSELLGKRRRGKNKEKDNSKYQATDSDVEDEVPILSRIPDPASFSSSAFRPTLDNAADTKSKRYLLPSTPRLTAKFPSGGQAGSSTTKVTVAEEGINTVRRCKDVREVHDQQVLATADFSTPTSMTQGQSIATQPSSAHCDAKFTFQSSPSAEHRISDIPSSGPSVRKTGQSPPHPQQAAPIAVSRPHPRLEHFTRERIAPEKPGRNEKVEEGNLKAQTWSGAHSDEGQIRSITTPTKSSEATTQATASKPAPSNRLFDSLRLGNSPTDGAPRIDKASPITNVSSFIRPQVPLPEVGPEVYRSFHHKPGTSRHLLERCLPDSIESKNFIEDVESGSMHGRKNENGDIPALVNDAHTERVPIGARRSDSVARTHMALFSGKAIMQPVTPSSLVSVRSRKPVIVPENLHTEPGRLAKAYFAALPAGSLKRKRPTGTALPPPSYIHKHTSKASFNIFTNGILMHPELCLLLAAQLPVHTLINLYSISKDYHIILNQRLTTVMLNQATLKAPAAVRCYPWRCYAHLCQPDPAYKAASMPIGPNLRALTTDGTAINVPSPPPPFHEVTTLPGYAKCSLSPLHPSVQPASSKRRVPTFRWLHMALHREKTIHEIYHLFAGRGVPLPGHPSDLSRNSFALSLHKLWFAFDIPDNTRRIAYFRSTTLITAYDLTNILTFIVKLDMLFNDPVAGEKRDALRKLVMSSVNGLDTLRRVLKKEIWTDEMEVLRAWTRYGFDLDREDPNEHARRGGGWVPMNLTEDDFAASDNVFGIPRDEVGLLRKEFWGKFDYNQETKMRTLCPMGRRTYSLMRPDQIVLREAIRRKMKMGKQFLKAMLVGYVDEVTLGAVEARDLNGGRGRVLEAEGEYGVDDLVGGVRALGVEEDGDPLLDLGDSWEGSPLTVKHVGARKQQLDRSKMEKERLEEYKKAWKEDVELEEARKAYRGFTYIDG